MTSWYSFPFHENVSGHDRDRDDGHDGHGRDYGCVCDRDRDRDDRGCHGCDCDCALAVQMASTAWSTWRFRDLVIIYTVLLGSSPVSILPLSLAGLAGASPYSSPRSCSVCARSSDHDYGSGRNGRVSAHGCAPRPQIAVVYSRSTWPCEESSTTSETESAHAHEYGVGHGSPATGACREMP